jgi:hypothetical protein
MDKYTVVIILTAIGFFALAAALLVPIWRFLSREEVRAEQWTRELMDASSRDAEDVNPELAEEQMESTPSRADDDERR